MKIFDYYAALTFELASTCCMILRLKQFTQKKRMPFNFFPLEDCQGSVRRRKKLEEMTYLEAMDSIIHCLDFEVTDEMKAKPRTTLKVISHDDDEGRCKALLSQFYTMDKEDKIQMKKFKKKVYS